MKKNIIILVFIILVCISKSSVTYAKDNINEKNYVRDYKKRVFTSDNGIQGTAVKSILSTSEGIIMFGAYTGLYTYDGNEFEPFKIGNNILVINTMMQDKKGNIWLGTNGDGVYVYDGHNAKLQKLSDDSSGSTVTKIIESENEYIYIGTKDGLFAINKRKKDSHFKKIINENVKDLENLSDGRIICISKSGKLYIIRHDTIEEFNIDSKYKDYVARCCADIDGYIYIGTQQSEILKTDYNGKVISIIKNDNLFAYNAIRKLDDNTVWLCCDVGIGILKNDKISSINFPINNSIEDVCMDYQGNIWFVSSRQGVLQLSKSYFSDLKNYLNFDGTVNTINFFNNKMYIGSDEGMLCYEGNKNIEDDKLVLKCEKQRIRQIYVDNKDRLWVASYQSGIYRYDKKGNIDVFSSYNSNLKTDQIRCIKQMKNGNMAIGTEEGLYFITKDDEVVKFKNSEDLFDKRILDIVEGENGKLYIGTDGNGLYVLENNEVKKIYRKENGLLSDVVMKIIISPSEKGIWLVNGGKIVNISDNGNIKCIENYDIINSLDLIVQNNGDVFIIAGNGFFKTTEDDLLRNIKDAEYDYYNKDMGIPIDFTANAFNIIYNNEIYLCGTNGISSFNINNKGDYKNIRIYVHNIEVDQQKAFENNGTIILKSNAKRVIFDVRLLQYSTERYYISSYLEGNDKYEQWIDSQKISKINYTNLKGGNYKYIVKVFDKNKEVCIKELTIPIIKNYGFWENPQVETNLAIAVIIVIFLCVVISIYSIGKYQKYKYKNEYQKKKKEDMERLASRDLVTGVYNRNVFELDRTEADIDKIKSVFTVSVNYKNYIQNKYGTLNMEHVLIQGVHVLEEVLGNDVKIYRIYDNIFCFWSEKNINIESFVRQIKDKFSENNEDDIIRSFAVGAVYNNGETIDNLVERCEKIRIIDEKMANAKFVHEKVDIL